MTIDATTSRGQETQLPLGVRYHADCTSFTVHADADAVRLRLVHSQTRALRVIDLGPTVNADVFTVDVEGDLRGWSYTYELRRGEQSLADIVDPWATLVRDGRGVIEAEGTHVAPRPVLRPSDAMIYELHLHDFTHDASSGVRPDWRGHYLGLIERGTCIPSTDYSSALDHIIGLGVNVVQLMPVHSFAMLNSPSYEWGYMPNDYNAPHGGYASDVDIEAPIREFKQLVSALHEAGLRVTLDVVYNHNAERWPDRLRSLMALAPKSYFRFSPEGHAWDGSACGNEFKSESPHGRRFLRESCRYWVERFGVDGFRFDLMGLIDAETMELIAQDVHAIDPSLLVYGEPWAAGPTPIKVNGHGKQRSRGWGVFNDHYRDGLRGDVFDLSDRGFLNNGDCRDAIKQGIRGGVDDFADSPRESINYIEVHDNHTLFDRLDAAAHNCGKMLVAEEREAMSSLGVLMLMTSQGIPFLHSGQEFGRTKDGHGNTYNRGDAINNIRWNLKCEHHELFTFHRDAVALRKAHPMFRLSDAAQVRTVIRFFDDDLKIALPEGVVAYLIEDPTGDDPWTCAAVIFNGGPAANSIALPEGDWQMAVRDNTFVDPGEMVEASDPIALAPHTGTILFEPR